MLLQITQRFFLIIQCLPFNLNIIFCSVITDAARVILKVVGSDTIAMLEHGKWIICAKISNRQRILWSYFEILLLQINFYIAISNRSVVLWCKVHFLYCHSKHDLPSKKIKKTRSTTSLDPQHLKVKESDISLTKNYCTIISIQKN